MNFPLHPALVHFPIAFLYGALILHAIQLWRPHWMCRIIGLWLLGMSAVISIATSIAGEREMIRAVLQKKGERAKVAQDLTPVLRALSQTNYLITIYFLEANAIFSGANAAV